MPTTTPASDVTAVLAAQAKMTQTPTLAPAQPATPVVNNSVVATVAATPALAAPSVSSPTILFRGGTGDQDTTADNDDTPDSGTDQSTPAQAPPIPNAAPIDSGSGASHIQTDGDVQQAVDTVFMSYRNGDSALVSEDTEAPQIAQATALAGFLLALGLRQSQKQSEPEATNRRRKH